MVKLVQVDKRHRIPLGKITSAKVFQISISQVTGQILLDPNPVFTAAQMQHLYDSDPELQAAIAYAQSLPTKPVVRPSREEREARSEKYIRAVRDPEHQSLGSVTLDARQRINLKKITKYTSFLIVQDEVDKVIALNPTVSIALQDIYDSNPRLRAELELSMSAPAERIPGV